MPTTVATHGQPQPTTASSTDAGAEEALRAEVARALAERGLDDERSLAQALGVLPGTARDLLHRSCMAVETCRLLVSKLGLDVDLPPSAVNPPQPRRPSLAPAACGLGDG